MGDRDNTGIGTDDEERRGDEIDIPEIDLRFTRAVVFPLAPVVSLTPLSVFVPRAGVAETRAEEGLDKEKKTGELPLSLKLSILTARFFEFDLDSGGVGAGVRVCLGFWFSVEMAVMMCVVL